MSDIGTGGEAIHTGSAATGIDPGDLSPDGHSTEAACLNCGTALTGNFCSACGQHAHVHRTLGAFFHDLAHSVFHFDGKLRNTLPLLCWRPGELTRRYVEGQRACFVSPMALFLFSVFAMFAVLSAMGSVGPPNRGEVSAEMLTEARKADSRLAGLERERAGLVAAGKPTATVDKAIEDARSSARALRSMAQRGVLSSGGVDLSDDLPAWLGKPVARATRNPELLLYKLRTNAYKWSWALIPLSVPFLWILFPFSRRFHLYDHMVFVTYSLSFMTLLVVTTAGIVAAGWSGAIAVAMFIPPIHMYRQLRGAYQLSRGGALWRTVVLTLFAQAAATLFVMMIVGMGLLD